MKRFGDTPDHSKGSLCRSCACGHVISGKRVSEEIVLCERGMGSPRLITFDVVSCTKYYSDAQTALHNFEEIAWELRTSSSGMPLGFKPPKKD